MQGTVAVEASGFYVPAMSFANYPTEPAQSDISRAPPTLALRVGLGDSWEIGGRLSNGSAIGGDLKWNFFKSSRFDLAIDPAYQISLAVAYESAGTASYLHAPLLVGVNLSRTVSLVLSPGVTWASISGGLRFKIGSETSGSAGPIERLGLGADLRITRGFALHPEFTFLRGLGSADTIIYMAGVGFNFGAIPNYDDVGAGPPAAPVPPPPM